VAATQTPRFTRESEAAPVEAPARLRLAGFVVALFAGPGRFSLDRAFGVDGRGARPFGATRTA
jgi:hypothetical protein